GYSARLIILLKKWVRLDVFWRSRARNAKTPRFGKSLPPPAFILCKKPYLKINFFYINILAEFL
ncbi:MAG: hypothetical protein ACFFB9_17395, partial [Promethearchaeota archaeon]